MGTWNTQTYNSRDKWRGNLQVPVANWSEQSANEHHEIGCNVAIYCRGTEHPV